MGENEQMNTQNRNKEINRNEEKKWQNEKLCQSD